MTWTGRGSPAGFGEEATYGTPVARTNWMPVHEWSVVRTIRREMNDHLGYSGQLGAHRDSFVAEEGAEGRLVVPASLDDSTCLLLKYCFGNVVDAGAGPYTHTYTFGDLQNPPTSKVALTIEALRGNSGKSDVVEGAMISRWAFSMSRSELARLELDIIAETLVRGSAGTPSMHSGTPDWMAHHNMGQVFINGVGYDARSIRLDCDNQLDKRVLVGSSFTKQPVPTGPRLVTLEVELEYTSDAPLTDWISGSQVDAMFTCTGTGSNQAAFTVHNAIIDEVNDPISSQGPISQTIRLKGFDDGTDAGLGLVITNGNTVHSAN